METQAAFCPRCHVAVQPTHYFCYNCGKEFHKAPPSTSTPTQLGLYVGSVFLAPMGLIWGMRYIRQPDSKSRFIGIVCIVLTVVTLIVVSKLATEYITKVNEQVTQQLNGMQGF